jgi:2-keto-3-deoxy-L-rhamnonate aldolase RhmA
VISTSSHTGQLRPNRAKRKLKAGQAVLSPNLGANSVPDLDTLELLASQGAFDMAWVEMEHGPWTWRELGDVARACDLHGITSAVRVNLNDPATITRTLDRGIQGVLVPHVNSKEEAERAVQGALYPPAGARGAGTSRQYFGIDRAGDVNWVHKFNDEVFVMVLLEEREVLQPARLKEILNVPGIDVFFVGPGDLSLSMGPKYALQTGHPEVQAIVRDALKLIIAEGKHAGTLVNDNNVEDFLNMGVRFLRYAAYPWMSQGLTNFHKKVKAVVPEP